MSDKIKYYVSALFIIGAVSLLIYNKYANSKNQNDEIYAGIDNADSLSSAQSLESLSILDLNATQDFKKINLTQFYNEDFAKESDDKIITIIKIATTSCYPCLNNVSEYYELIAKDKKFLDPFILFLDENKNEVQKYLTVANIDRPFKLAKSESVDSVITKEFQHIFFIDKNTQKLFYKSPLYSSTTGIEYKNRVLIEVRNKWHESFPEKSN